MEVQRARLGPKKIVQMVKGEMAKWAPPQLYYTPMAALTAWGRRTRHFSNFIQKKYFMSTLLNCLFTGDPLDLTSKSENWIPRRKGNKVDYLLGVKLPSHIAAGREAMQYRQHHSLTLVESPPLWFLKAFPRTCLRPHRKQGQHGQPMLQW